MASAAPSFNVTFEDQQMMNEFGQLQDKLEELQVDITDLQTQVERLDDATTELMMGDGGHVSLMLGEAFISVAEDTATEYCEKRQEVLTDRLESMKETRDNIVKRQAELKKYLYGKFGNNINLDK